MLISFCRTFARAYFLHVLLCAQVNGQTPSPFARLSSDPFFPSDSGEFTWPAGESTGTFSEGAKMNISWITTYPAINLWLITNQSWAQPSSIILTAEPDTDEQEHGGFYSRQFWIKSDKSGDAVSSSSRSATSSTQNLSPTASSHTTSPSSTTTSGSKSIPTSASSTPALTSDSGMATPSPSAAEDGGGSTSTTLGVGIGVGLGVALFIAAVFFFWRRSRRHAKAAKGSSAHALGSETLMSSKWPREHVGLTSTTAYTSSAVSDSKSAQAHNPEMAGDRGMSEMAGGQLEPQELSAGSPVNGWR